MSEWVGFSDADLQRMKRMAEDGGSPQSGTPKIVKPVSGGRPKPGSSMGQKPQRKQNPRTVVNRSQRAHGDVPAGAMLSKPPPKKAEHKKGATSPPVTPTTPNEQIPLHGKTSPSPAETEQKCEALKETEREPVKEPEILEDEEKIQEKEKLKLEDIQRRQKEMEEKNKRKKTMLTKAIAERKKKAFAESTKLVKIQSELSKLDDMLNYDVSILRDRIDAACGEYNNAQRRFEKAETEYIDAKIKLHKATEMKEELTEHLYKLIQLNEERKANKLEELMQKLELEEMNDPYANEATPQSSTSENLKPEAKSEEQSTESSENKNSKTEEKAAMKPQEQNSPEGSKEDA